MKGVDGARSVATVVLCRVAENNAFAAASLDAELARAKLDSRDAALATEIVYGALRVLPLIDHAFTPHLKRPEKTDALVLAALRSAAYQLLFLSRVAPHGVVDETVTFIRLNRGPRMAGFVNAVLRKLAQARPELPERPDHLVVPEWLRPVLEASIGNEHTAAFLDARAIPPPTGLRVRGDTKREELLAEIQHAKPTAQGRLAPSSPVGLLVSGAGAISSLPGFESGRFTVQEEGAQLVALALDAQPGERVADLCAGRGGKTTLLAEQVGDAGHVVAVDMYDTKLLNIYKELDRLRVPQARVSTLAVDLSVGLGGLKERSFDRVLVDAPCTGLGTIHRRPEILMRIREGDPTRMGDLQRKILHTASALVKPGGYLLYAVCTPTRAEGHDVVQAFLRDHPEFELLDPEMVQVGPWMDKERASPDLFQYARMKRR